MLDRRLTLYAPRFLGLGYAKYANELRGKSRLSENNFGELTKILLRRIRLVPDDEIMLYYKAALGLVSDKKDAPYVACALSTGADIWSNDRHLSGTRIRNWKTNELLEKMQM